MPQAGGRQTDNARETEAATGIFARLQEPKSRAGAAGPALVWPSSHSNALNADQDMFVHLLPLESLAEKHFVRQQKHNVLLFIVGYSHSHIFSAKWVPSFFFFCVYLFVLACYSLAIQHLAK